MKQRICMLIIAFVSIACTSSAALGHSLMPELLGQNQRRTAHWRSGSRETSNLAPRVTLMQKYTIHAPNFTLKSSSWLPLRRKRSHQQLLLISRWQKLFETLKKWLSQGLATTVKRSNAANAVAQINAKELTGITTQSTFYRALQGKFPGVQITENPERREVVANIRMRGLTSIGSSAQPLFIIDGVYIDNSSISAGHRSTHVASEATQQCLIRTTSESFQI